MMWIWIIIGMSVVLLILVFFAVYFCIQNRNMNKWAAQQYANGAGDDGSNLLDKDSNDYGGKGAKRVNQFEDHKDLMESTHEIIDDEPIPSPYALQ